VDVNDHSDGGIGIIKAYGNFGKKTTFACLYPQLAWGAERSSLNYRIYTKDRDLSILGLSFSSLILLQFRLKLTG
jgi:hypothetical protein